MFGEKRRMTWRNEIVIRDGIINRTHSHGSRVSQVTHLDWRGPERQNLGPGVSGVPLEINQNSDAAIADPARRFFMRKIPNVGEMVHRTDRSFARGAAV